MLFLYMKNKLEHLLGFLEMQLHWIALKFMEWRCLGILVECNQLQTSRRLIYFKQQVYFFNWIKEIHWYSFVYANISTTNFKKLLEFSQVFCFIQLIFQFGEWKSSFVVRKRQVAVHSQTQTLWYYYFSKSIKFFFSKPLELGNRSGYWWNSNSFYWKKSNLYHYSQENLFWWTHNLVYVWTNSNFKVILIWFINLYLDLICFLCSQDYHIMHTLQY